MGLSKQNLEEHITISSFFKSEANIWVPSNLIMNHLLTTEITFHICERILKIRVRNRADFRIQNPTEK